MKKTKLTRSLLAACSIVALSAVMYGCTSDGSEDDTGCGNPGGLDEGSRTEADAATGGQADWIPPTATLSGIPPRPSGIAAARRTIRDTARASWMTPGDLDTAEGERDTAAGRARWPIPAEGERDTAARDERDTVEGERDTALPRCGIAAEDERDTAQDERDTARRFERDTAASGRAG